MDAGEGVVTDNHSLNASVSNPEYDVTQVIDAHIFGEAKEPAREDVTRAPETKLQINLLGLIASADKRLARAILDVSSAKTEAYTIGQTIDGTNAIVHAVEPKRVLLKRGNALESLSLERQRLAVSDSSRNAD